jgi:hypothetical protein
LQAPYSLPVPDVIVIDTGEFTLIIFLIFVFVAVFEVSEYWAGRFLAFIYAVAVSALICIAVFLAIIYSALP